MKKMICYILCVMFLISIIELANSESTPQLTINEQNVSVAKGKTIKLSTSVENVSNSKKLKYVWESSDTGVATVNNGTVKAVDVGRTTITCSTILEDGTELKALTEINVIIQIKNIKFHTSKISLNVGSTYAIEYTVVPDNASDISLEWSSSNPDIAIVDQRGTVTTLSTGNVTITGKTRDESNKKASISIEVSKPILFRDIPWGANLTTAAQIGKFKNTFWFDNPSDETSTRYENLFNGFIDRGDVNTSKSVWQPDPIIVADYETNSCSLYFTYGLEDGTVIKDNDHCQFAMGIYSFMMHDKKKNKEAMDHFISVLTELYGNPGKPKNVKGGWKHLTWYDADNNKIIMSMATYDFRICYVWNKADELLKQISEIESKSLPTPSGSTDGL